jgi:YgiT-type zinc finger domain-containing protein
MKAETRNETCSVCGTRLRVENITYTQVIGDKVYFVSDVPAEVCSQCGEQYLSPSTVDAIQIVLETGKATKSVNVPVYELASTAI